MKHIINSIAIAGLTISFAAMIATALNELAVASTIASAFVLFFSETIADTLKADDNV